MCGLCVCGVYVCVVMHEIYSAPQDMNGTGVTCVVKSVSQYLPLVRSQLHG